jgi:hypothetical protein
MSKQRYHGHICSQIGGMARCPKSTVGPNSRAPTSQETSRHRSFDLWFVVEQTAVVVLDERRKNIVIEAIFEARSCDRATLKARLRPGGRATRVTIKQMNCRSPYAVVRAVDRQYRSQRCAKTRSTSLLKRLDRPTANAFGVDAIL